MEEIKQQIPNTTHSYFKKNAIQSIFQNPKIYIGYCQTNNKHKDIADNEINIQELMIIKYCQKHKIFIREIYYDEGISNSVDRKDRPGLDITIKNLYNLKRSGYDCSLIVMDHSRIYHQTSKITVLAEQFIQKNIGMYFLNLESDASIEKQTFVFQTSCAVTANNNQFNNKIRKIIKILKIQGKYTETYRINSDDMKLIEYIRELKSKNPNIDNNKIIDILNKEL